MSLLLKFDGVSRARWLFPISLALNVFFVGAADAEVVRSELRTNAEKVASAQADLRLSREELRNDLRADPFDANALRAAMAANRAARENFELVLNGVLATAAGKMSVVGRNKLADWSTTRGRASAQ